MHSYNSAVLHVLAEVMYVRKIRRCADLYRGFTLLELLVTMAILAILVAIAVPSMTSFIVNSELRSTISTLQTDAMNARAEAIKLQRSVVLRPNVAAGTWTSGWKTVVLDTAGADSQTLVTRDVISDKLTVGKDTVGSLIRYDSNGFARQPNNAFLAGCVRFDASYTSRSSGLVFDAAGRPRLGTGTTTSAACN